MYSLFGGDETRRLLPSAAALAANHFQVWSLSLASKLHMIEFEGKSQNGASQKMKIGQINNALKSVTGFPFDFGAKGGKEPILSHT